MELTHNMAVVVLTQAYHNALMMPFTNQVKKNSMKRNKQSGISRSFQFLDEPHSGRLGLISKEYESVDEFKKVLDTYYDEKRQNAEMDYERACNGVRMMFMSSRHEVPDEIKFSIMKSKVNECYYEDVEDKNKDQKTTVVSRSSRLKHSTKNVEFKIRKESTQSTNHRSSRKRTPSVTPGHVPPAEGLKDYVGDQNNNLKASVLPRESTRSSNRISSRKRTPSVTPGHVPPAEGLRDYVGDKNKNLNVSVLPRESTRTNNCSSSRKRSPSVTSTPPAEGFKTPLMSCRKLLPGATITPKIYNDSPINVMRRPFHGEIAISMNGSPLIVSATSRENIPTVNIPVKDGKIFSIVPEVGQPPSDFPQFDDTTKEYLKILHRHLQVLAPNSP